MTPTPKILSGSYQDFVDGNTADKKFQFRLTKFNRSPSFVDAKGRGQIYVNICDMPNTGIITEKNSKGEWVNRVIRYIPGEQSIYKDQQSDDEANPKKRVSIRFERGFKTVGGKRDRLLLEFLMKCNLNATNPNRTEIEPWFELVDTDKTIKEAMAKDEALDEAKYFCRKGAWDEVKAVAMVLGLKSDLTTDETRWNLRTIAERDPQKFLDLQKDPKMKMKYSVLEAIDKGFLVINHQANSIAWLTNRLNPIYTAVIGRDIVDGFVNQLSTIEGLPLYNAILGMIYPQSDKLPKMVIPTQEEMDKAKLAANPPAPMLKDCILNDTEVKELIEKGIRNEVIGLKGNMPWLTFGAGKYPKAEGFAKVLKSDEELLKTLIEAVG